jgi:hypothetical protein
MSDEWGLGTQEHLSKPLCQKLFSSELLIALYFCLTHSSSKGRGNRTRLPLPFCFQLDVLFRHVLKFRFDLDAIARERRRNDALKIGDRFVVIGERPQFNALRL